MVMRQFNRSNVFPLRTIWPLGLALVVAAGGVDPAPARAQTAASGASPDGSTPTMSPEMVERMREQFRNAQNDPRFQPETAESIRRKLQSGEYRLDVRETPWYLRFGKLVFLVVSIVMFIVTLVVRLTAKKEPQAGAAQDDLRRADALAQAARAKYRTLFRQADAKNFRERREALATEGVATEALFRQAAEQYQAAAEKAAQGAETENPAAAARRRTLAKAFAEQAAAQTALAEIAALLGDPLVTSADEFRRRAAGPAQGAEAAAENSRRLLKEAGKSG